MADKTNSEVKAVEHESDGGKDWLKEQNEALTEYRVSGVNKGYVDPTRDQEPDIAPEFGVAPHPDLFNPAPPAESFSGRALNPATNPMVLPVDEKVENAKDATKAFNEALEQREEAFQAMQANAGSTADAPQRVVIVDEDAEEDAPAGIPSLPSDESPKASEQSGEQLAAVPADSEDNSSKDSK